MVLSRDMERILHAIIWVGWAHGLAILGAWPRYFGRMASTYWARGLAISQFQASHRDVWILCGSISAKNPAEEPCLQDSLRKSQWLLVTSSP